jgi:hypothetical protein
MLHKFIMPSLRLLFIASLLLAVNVQAQMALRNIR